jgi:UDP-N-acetylglucosamine 4,6-dehydratase
MVFKNKKLLITGGTGSFGRHVVDIFLKTEIDELRVFSRDEKKQDEMRLELNDERVKFYIGDVRDYSSIYDALGGVNYIFHAAALKQVPSCEFYPMEAIKTNILGAENVMNAAIYRGVEKVVLLSTDKAVYPINAMGQTKALMEKIMIAKTRQLDASNTAICATRYGNVMASRGSVIPLFISQILEKKSITITDPNMTRFLMSLDDSVDLVMHAFNEGKGGEIYIQKSPAATVLNLAESLKKIFNAKSDIKIIGTRHGEKLFESLVSREEMARAKEMDRYFQIPPDNRNLNYDMYFTSGEQKISNIDDYTSHNTRRLSASELEKTLLSLPYLKKYL